MWLQTEPLKGEPAKSCYFLNSMAFFFQHANNGTDFAAVLIESKLNWWDGSIYVFVLWYLFTVNSKKIRKMGYNTLKKFNVIRSEFSGNFFDRIWKINPLKKQMPR